MGNLHSRLNSHIGTRQLQVEFSCDGSLDEEIWVLLTRHVVDTHRTSDFTALRVEVEDDVALLANAVESQYTLSSKVKCLPMTAILSKQSLGDIYQQHSYSGSIDICWQEANV